VAACVTDTKYGQVRIVKFGAKNGHAPIRPIINWKNAPANELVKKLTKTLHSYLNLSYTYNVRNSNHLMTELKTIKLDSNIRMVK
jgi:hypothetical protein